MSSSSMQLCLRRIRRHLGSRIGFGGLRFAAEAWIDCRCDFGSSESLGHRNRHKTRSSSRYGLLSGHALGECSRRMRTGWSRRLKFSFRSSSPATTSAARRSAYERSGSVKPRW